MRELRLELARLELRKVSEWKINVLKYVGKREEEMHRFVHGLRQQGYSVRDVMLDDETLLLYRVFLPRGSRMEDKTQ